MSCDAPEHSCCSPARSGGAAHAAQANTDLSHSEQFTSTQAPRHRLEQCTIPAGEFFMGDTLGDAIPGDGERPAHPVSVEAFQIDATAVTNAQFAEFFADTGYVTDAERYGSSAVFHLLVDAPTEDIVGAAAGVPWWINVLRASWKHPGGVGTSVVGFDDHPVVHVSWNDAMAYCEWAGRRLPTEAEWERAARGGIEKARHPWGNEPIDGSDGVWRANVWQGMFPAHNSAADGWVGTAPVKSYAPNGFGLWQPIGNVWEWCADWFAEDTYVSRIARDKAMGPATGPEAGTERILRGGSFLCHVSYCYRYRNSARSRNTPESSMANAGFRTVALDPVS